MSCAPLPLIFDPARLYRCTDPALRVLGSRSTLAKWRYQDIGPVFIQYGPRIIYRGWDLNFYIGNTAAEQSCDAPPPAFRPSPALLHHRFRSSRPCRPVHPGPVAPQRDRTLVLPGWTPHSLPWMRPQRLPRAGDRPYIRIVASRSRSTSLRRDRPMAEP